MAMNFTGTCNSTTTTLSPDEVHQQGLEELEALHARMDPILRKIGYTDCSVGAS